MVRRLAAVVAVVIAFQAVERHAGAEVDCPGLIAAIDDFMVEQMQRFDVVRPAGHPPLTQTFGWGVEESFPPGDLNPPPECGSPPHARAPLSEMQYRGDVYDQALAALWFVERARLEFVAGHTEEAGENLARAQSLLDVLIQLAGNDPYSDGRLRAAYWANNPLGASGGEASIMDPAVGVGNLAYFGIALTRFYKVANDYDVAVENNYPGAPTRHAYLDLAEVTAGWVLDHTWDPRGPGGFTGGYEGWNQPPLEQTAFTWKSTEHNIDVYVLAKNLFALRANLRWLEMANHAAQFVRAMYDESCGCYLTGTADDGATPNPSPIPADAQAWTALARSGALEIDSVDRAQTAMQWLLANLKEGSPCETLPDEGVKFSDVGKGMQSEITASAALALLWLSQQAEQADAFLVLLNWLRLNPLFPGGVDHIAVAATACSNGAWTGYGPDAWYYPLQHVASSAWSGFACLVREGNTQANPLMPLGGVDQDEDGILDDGDGSGIIGDAPCTGGETETCDDNCTFRTNASQADANGDGIGDVCQCGDTSGNGFIDGADLTLYKRYFGGLSSPFSADRCGVSPAPDGGACDGADLTVIKRHFGGLPPGVTNSCSAYVGP